MEAALKGGSGPAAESIKEYRKALLSVLDSEADVQLRMKALDCLAVAFPGSNTVSNCTFTSDSSTHTHNHFNEESDFKFDLAENDDE